MQPLQQELEAISKAIYRHMDTSVVGCSRKTYCWRAAQTWAIQWSALLQTELLLLKEHKSKQLKLFSYTLHQPPSLLTSQENTAMTSHFETFLQHFINFTGTASSLQIINAISLFKEYFINCKTHLSGYKTWQAPNPKLDHTVHLDS